MLEIPTVWIDNSPDSLLDLAVNSCIDNPISFCQYNLKEACYELREGLSLPEEICEKMLVRIVSKEGNINSLIKIFSDTYRTRLRRVNFGHSSITNIVLQTLSNHSISELDVSRCKLLTKGSLQWIGKLWKGLYSLNLGIKARDFFVEQSSKSSGIDEVKFLKQCLELLDEGVDEALNAFAPQTPSQLELPALRKLVVHDVPQADCNSCFMTLLKSAQYLTHLDLTKCELRSDFSSVLVQKHLMSLTLCDVTCVQDLVPAVCELKGLRHLDISNTGDHVMTYDNPNQTLTRIVTSLENLVSLDISGTNLAGGRTWERPSKGSMVFYEEEVLTDIPGLASRVNRPLEFLGLLNCAHDACYRHHIPAKRIAGDANEDQILTAGQAYCGREAMIQKVLNDLFPIFRFSTCMNTKLALDVVMESMRLHIEAKHIQVSGSASLFYMVKGEHKDLFNIKMRRKIITLLIDAMFLHYSDVTMLRNGCLTLIHFKIPDDVFFGYERLAILLLLIVGQDEQDEFVQRIGVYLLNSLACQVDGIEKKLVGDRGAIKIMLQLIERRLQRNVCDEVMETAWSTMWNVTDETPINCARFLENKGMDLFLGCLEAFPQKPELLRNMMGLLGNVAEVKELRSHLMKDEYLIVFSNLLNSRSDGIEVSYNAAGILSHIASDGSELWDSHMITSVQRDDVLGLMVGAIEKWSLDTKRNINYRSFKPILRLLTVAHTPEAQYWAVWALANLTKVYPEKYCTLLKEEGGVTLLKDLLKDSPSRNPSRKKMVLLAELTVQNCDRYEINRNSESFDEDDDDDSLDLAS